MDNIYHKSRWQDFPRTQIEVSENKPRRSARTAVAGHAFEAEEAASAQLENRNQPVMTRARR